MFDRRVKEKGTIHYRVSLPEHWAALIDQAHLDIARSKDSLLPGSLLEPCAFT